MSEQNNSNDQQNYPDFEFNQPIEMKGSSKPKKEGPLKSKDKGPLKDEDLGPMASENKRHNQQDILGSITWALILVWAGLVFLASNFGWLDAVEISPILPEALDFIGLSTWSLIFLGAGVLIFIESLISTFVPSFRSNKSGNFFLSAIFLGIGLSGIFGWDLIWPFVLIFLGITALASALIKRK